ncbi:MAG TPA: filamentous hemagglutinin N-terminal domain-containing protein, partial [Burkholderiales bacterium]|nr:filamentous hemagglutinin N-terminal domain-containing protein [Burkholderiales bacterium]
MSNAMRAHKDSLRPKLIALSVAACFGVSASQSSANPTGGTVSSGSASFAAAGNTLTITNTAGTIINWQSFSIGVNEITRFLQSSGSSAVLNRVVGRSGVVPQSVIDGILSSNGRVFLLNSSGILIGAGARIDVAGFVASSLNLSDQDFLAGKMRFTETPGAGKVSNAGTIDTSSAGPGGRVFLVGSDVENSGIIRTPQGQILLAAGKSAELVSENTPFVTVSITADSEQALNVGQLVADSGHIGMFGALVRQGGVAQANSAVVGANGEIKLVATQDLALDAGSVTTANGPSGGNVTLQAQGGTNLIYGTVAATGSSGQGGTIQALGVRVGVLGNGVIDASGDTGGGTVLVGGDQHGANPSVQNAQQTLIGPDGVIRADASTTGDGGRVIVWSDQWTQDYGSVSARGGALSGNGGFVETSSGAGMDLTGVRIDLRAPAGRSGTWLIDPLDVVIEPNSYAGGYAFAGNVLGFNDNPGQSLHITEQTIENNFSNVGNTSIQATHDVLFKADLNLTYATVTPVQTFEVRAQNNIDMAYANGVHTITTNGQNVTLSANDAGVNFPTATLNTTSGTGSILGGGNIVTNGGNVVLSGYGVNVGTVSTSPITPIIVGAGYVSMLSYGADISTGSITTHAVTNGTTTSPGGYVTLSTTYGNILVNGTIDTHGADGANARSSNSGTNGGNVNLVRTSQTTPGTITVTGNILTYGGAGVPGTVAQTVVGNGGSGGGVFIYGGDSPASGLPITAYGGVAVNGNINSRGGYGGAGFQANAGGSGGSGGQVFVYGDASHNVTIGSPSGSIDASGGAGGAGNAAYSVYASGLGGIGGSGGVIGLYGGAIVVNGGIASYGGAGGAGGDGISASLYGSTGGAGGNGGIVNLGSANSPVNTINVTGAIAADGGAAGNGGAYGGNGGDNLQFQGGFGGTITAYGASTVALGAVSANGGAGGAGAGGIVTAYSSSINIGQGGSGNAAGSITVYGLNVTSGAITAKGGTGGAGGSGINAFVYGINTGTNFNGSANVGASGNGGSGGFATLNSTGSITVSTIDVSGGTSGAAGSGNTAQVLTDGAATVLPVFASVEVGHGGGNTFGAGNGGQVLIAAAGDVAITSILANGSPGALGGGGSATATANSTSNSVNASANAGFGGFGGGGGSVTVNSTGSGNISIGSVTATGGAGGAGGNGSAFSYATTTSGAYGASAQSSIGSGGGGFQGGYVGIANVLGYISIPGGIDASGGLTGPANGAGTAVASASSPSTTAGGSAQIFLGDGGEGGSGGQIALAGVNISTGTLSLLSRAGGDGVGAASFNATGTGPLVVPQVFFGNGGGTGGI